MSTKIEWTERTWNPITGCMKTSPGCHNCYAIRLARRLAHSPNMAISTKYNASVKKMQNGGINWTGHVLLDPEALQEPLKRKKPTRYFVCSMSDLFYEKVPSAWIDQVLSIIQRCPQHTFMILTKRSARMREYFSTFLIKNPLKNLQLGVSVESDDYAFRIDDLINTPAVCRFISYEPALGPLNIKPFKDEIDLVICGGESGPGARPMHPDWARSIRDQCQAAGVAFFFKQWGEYAPCKESDGPACNYNCHLFPDGEIVGRWGKKAAGRLLDGREWNEMPSPKSFNHLNQSSDREVKP